MAEQRIRFDYDYSGDTWPPEGANGEPLPEPEAFYTENAYQKNGETVTYAEYLRTFGDPENYTPTHIVAEEKCECCGLWHAVGQVWDNLYISDQSLLGNSYAVDSPEIIAFGLGFDELAGMNVPESG